MNSEKVTNINEKVASVAAALYDGGWKSEDRDEIISAYDFTEEEADYICEVLKIHEALDNTN